MSAGIISNEEYDKENGHKCDIIANGNWGRLYSHLTHFTISHKHKIGGENRYIMHISSVADACMTNVF